MWLTDVGLQQKGVSAALIGANHAPHGCRAVHFRNRPRMSISPRQKLAFQMREQGLSGVEIAKRLNIKPPSVCRLLQRAEAEIRKMVEGCEDVDLRNLKESLLN